MPIAWELSRFLVTGGAGLIGSHITDKLVERGAKEIVILDNFIRGRWENLSWALERGSVRVVEGDIRDAELVRHVVGSVDYVFHQAALRITHCAAEPRLCLEVMVDGTFNVLEACVAANIKKLVVASTASIYGMASAFPTDETHHPYSNRTLYGAAKVANEQMCRSFSEMYGLPYVALRYFNVYGPRMDIYGAYTEVMIRWLDCIDRGELPVIFGDSSQTMDFVYVEDVAEANLKAMESDVSDEVFNVAGGIETSLKQLWGTLKALTNSPLETVHQPERKVNPVRRRLASTEKARRMLGFQAHVDLREGLRRLIAWRAEQRQAAVRGEA